MPSLGGLRNAVQVTLRLPLFVSRLGLRSAGSPLRTSRSQLSVYVRQTERPAVTRRPSSPSFVQDGPAPHPEEPPNWEQRALTEGSGLRGSGTSLFLRPEPIPSSDARTTVRRADLSKSVTQCQGASATGQDGHGYTRPGHPVGPLTTACHRAAYIVDGFGLDYALKQKRRARRSLSRWSGRRGSNSRPPPWQGGAQSTPGDLTNPTPAS